MPNPGGLEHPEENGPRLLLADHHTKIEAAGNALRVAAFGDDTLELVTRWRCFEHGVITHLDAEEHLILHAYADYAADDAALIRAAHDDLRRQLFRLGVDVELHCVRAASIDRLLQTLREHAAHEDRGMYPWAQVHLPPRTRRELFSRMIRALRLLPFVAHDVHNRAP